jgi:hypothetical protein
MKIAPNTGYWRTDNCPIGESFHRTGPEGLVILEIIRAINPSVRGATVEVLTPLGKVAIDRRRIELDFDEVIVWPV